MNVKKNQFLLGAFCTIAAVATTVVAQENLDDILNNIEATASKKPAAQVAQPAAVEAAPAATEKKEEAAPAVVETAPAAQPVAEEKKEEAAPAVAEAAPAAQPAVEEKKEEAAPAAQPAAEEKKEEAAPAVAEAAPAAQPAVEEKKEEAAPAVAEAAPAAQPATEEKKEEAAPAAQPAVAEKKAEAPAASNADAELIADLAATEALRREALDKQAIKEIEGARDAFKSQDYESCTRLYKLALQHLNDRPDSADLRRECNEGIAEAQYQAGKLALKEGNRDLSKSYAEEALKWHHPRARALLDALNAERTQVVEKDYSDIKHRRNDKDYKDDRNLVRSRLRLSSQFMAVGDLDNALEQCDIVLRSDPYNRDAIALRARIQRRREIIIDKEREATRKGMIADVGAAWRPVYAVNAAELKETDGGTSKTPVGSDPERTAEQSIEKRMKEMMLPSITFKPPATIIDAVDFFRQASKDYDRPEIPADQRGFNFVLDLGKPLTAAAEENADAGKADDNSFAASSESEGAAAAGDVPQIPNISASNVTLWEAMKLVCKISGFKFKVQGPVVMVMPKDMSTDELITRSYNVVESFLDRMNNASSDLKDQKAGSFGGDSKEGDEAEGNQEAEWKNFFKMMGVTWPKNSAITYIKTIGKLRVTNTADQLAILEQALNELNVTPMLIEIETRFVEVAQEDLNSLGFEWLLNSDYSLNVGGKLGKALGLKDITQQTIKTDATTVTDVKVLPNGSAMAVDHTVGGTEQTVWRKWNDSKNFTGTSAYRQFDPVAQKYVWNSGNPGNTADWANGVATTVPASYKWNNDSQTYEVAQDAYTSYGRSKTHKNLGINAVNGTDYSTGMRYLSSENSSITKADGTKHNDQFMKLNAFLGNADLSMILHMLSQRSDTDLLSAPKVVTKSGQEATIKVVTIYRYPQDYDVTIQSTSSGSSSGSTSTGGSDGKILPMVEPQNFTDVEVGVILTVTPDVSAEGQLINLELKPKIVSEPTWKDYGMKVPMSVVMSSTESAVRAASGAGLEWFNVPMEQPFFKERSIETHISIYNGATVVMGGLITEERKSMEDKIPFLGDIPYIGRFFRSRSEWSDKRNLLLFVTARLVDPRGRQMTIATGEDNQTASSSAKVTPAPEADK